MLTLIENHEGRDIRFVSDLEVYSRIPVERGAGVVSEGFEHKMIHSEIGLELAADEICRVWVDGRMVYKLQRGSSNYICISKWEQQGEHEHNGKWNQLNLACNSGYLDSALGVAFFVFLTAKDQAF